MNARGQFAYSQARLQARLGEQVAPEALQQLHSARDLAGLLAAIRATPQRRYAARLAPGLDPHELERHLRDEWIALVDEVAQWQPAAWRASVRWLRWLPSLPLLHKLARGGRPPAWARSDALLGRIVASEPGLRGSALGTTPLRALRVAFETPHHDVLAAWFAHWQALWPREATMTRALQLIARDVATCNATLREAGARDSGASLQALRERLLRRFRRHPLSPAAAVAFLALEGMALLDVRGQVLRRAVIEPGPA